MCSVLFFESLKCNCRWKQFHFWRICSFEHP